MTQSFIIYVLSNLNSILFSKKLKSKCNIGDRDNVLNNLHLVSEGVKNNQVIENIHLVPDQSTQSTENWRVQTYTLSNRTHILFKTGVKHILYCYLFSGAILKSYNLLESEVNGRARKSYSNTTQGNILWLTAIKCQKYSKSQYHQRQVTLTWIRRRDVALQIWPLVQKHPNRVHSTAVYS
jgi:hypothetical protein